MDIYGRYKNVRNASWKIFIDYEIKSLPISLTNITNKSNINIIKNKDIGILKSNMDGVTILDDNTFYIVYNENMSLQRKRFTIAHELGHIFLGHFINTDKDNLIEAYSYMEVEANKFAIRLLAPACVLYGLNVNSSEHLARVCQISMSSANIRFERLKKLYERNKFFTCEIERTVFNQFKDYIRKNRN